MADELKTHEANVFLPGCLGPVRRDVVLFDDHNEIVAALRAELTAVKVKPFTIMQPVEPIDVVGYASPGQIEILKTVPLTGGMKVKGTRDKRYTEPLVTLAATRSAVFNAVVRCEQRGAFKTCMECGYQDGHDQICQYHESKRADPDAVPVRRKALELALSNDPMAYLARAELRQLLADSEVKP